MDVADAEMVEKQLDVMIQRRARKGDLDPNEQHELWKASVRAYNARRADEMRAQWCEYHQEQAARHAPLAWGCFVCTTSFAVPRLCSIM